MLQMGLEWAFMDKCSTALVLIRDTYDSERPITFLAHLKVFVIGLPRLRLPETC